MDFPISVHMKGCSHYGNSLRIQHSPVCIRNSTTVHTTVQNDSSDRLHLIYPSSAAMSHETRQESSEHSGFLC